MINAQNMKFSIKDFFSKCEQIRSFLRIWSYLLKKSLMENLLFCTVDIFVLDIIKCINLHDSKKLLYQDFRSPTNYSYMVVNDLPLTR